MLTYTVEKTVKEQRQLRVPSEWGMFTWKGNNSLKQKATKLVENVEKADSFKKKLNAFSKYFKAYTRMENCASYRESGDTAVREAVWCFALKVGEAVGVDYCTLDKLWDGRYR